MSLALATTGFRHIASFMVLFYAHRHWADAAFALTSFGAAFIFARLLFAHSIDRWGGFRWLGVCLSVEIAGLALLWLAFNPAMAFTGAALTGLGFAGVSRPGRRGGELRHPGKPWLGAGSVYGLCGSVAGADWAGGWVDRGRGRLLAIFLFAGVMAAGALD